MAKSFIYYFFFSYTVFVFGQNIKTIHIDMSNALPLDLSEIVDSVTPIALETRENISNGNIILTNEYLFTISISGFVVQFDLSGRLIRTIDCGGFVTGSITSDTVKKELYVPVGELIKCYDYSGKLNKEISLQTQLAGCFYHNGDLWVHSYDNQSDRSIINTINRVNLSTGKVTKLPFEIKKEPMQTPTGSFINAVWFSKFTLYNDEVIISFDHADNVMYRIQQDKIMPFVRWDINPPAVNSDVYSMKANGFIGNYLFIHYRRNDQYYIYLENTKTGEKYNVSNLIDNVFHTDGYCEIYSMNQKGHFFFIKTPDKIKGNIPLKTGPVIFIVKTK